MYCVNVYKDTCQNPKCDFYCRKVLFYWFRDESQEELIGKCGCCDHKKSVLKKNVTTPNPQNEL